jgi:hypothetical protein
MHVILGYFEVFEITKHALAKRNLTTFGQLWLEK